MKKKLLIIGICLLFLFTIFSYAIQHGSFRNSDFAFTVKVQEAIDRSPRLRLSRVVGEIMEGSTFFASPEISVVAVLLITACVFYDIRKKKIRWVVLIIPLCFFLLVMGEVYGKSVVHHPSPPFFMIKNPTTIFPKYYINEQFSYPSGHAARAVFIAFVLSYFILPACRQARHTSYFRRKNVQIGSVLILIGYIVLVSVSRIYLGHHWLSDIIGGVLLGGGMGTLALAFLPCRTDG